MERIRIIKNRDDVQRTRQRRQTPYKWLRDHTSGIDFGIKLHGHPIHCNQNKEVLIAFRSENCWLDGMRNRDYDAHFAGTDTYYFTGDARKATKSTLLMIDIDCHESGTLKGAVEFARYLRTTLFPNLYFETSTNGNGVHAYLVVFKSGLGATALNGLYSRLEYKLREVLRSGHFDVQDVEVKGTCPVFGWGRMKRELLSYTSGQLAKLPRCVDRFEEWKATTEIDAYSLFRLPIPPKPTEIRTSVAGSCSGKCLSRDELDRLKGQYREIAQKLLPEGVLRTVGIGRDVVTIQDLAIFLMLGKFFTENMPSNGAMPTKRWQNLWTSLFEAGDVSRPFNGKRFAAIRNLISSFGLIDWENEHYTPGFVSSSGKWVNGMAARWKFSLELMEVLQEEERERSSMVTSTDEVVDVRQKMSKPCGDHVVSPVKYYPKVVPAVDLNDFVPIFDPIACLAA